MIKRFHLDLGVNDYAVITDPDNNDEERTQLLNEGYTRFSSYYTVDGDKEELWVK